jgi:membrane protein DedA with SNARE-associated domain
VQDDSELTPAARRIYLAVMVVTTAAAALGTALLPMLLVESPALLLLSAADFRNIALVSTQLDLHTVLAVGLPRRIVGMFGSYGLGILYGRSLLGFAARRLPRVGKFVSALERLFRRFPRATLLLWPAYATSIFAGLARLPLRTFVPCMLVGQVGFVVGAYFLGGTISGPIDAVVEFFKRYLWESTAVCATLVALQQLSSYRRRRQRKPEPAV